MFRISKFFKWLFPGYQEEIICCQVGKTIKVVCDHKLLYEGPINQMPNEVRRKLRRFKAYENLELYNIFDIFKY